MFDDILHMLLKWYEITDLPINKITDLHDIQIQIEFFMAHSIHNRLYCCQTKSIQHHPGQSLRKFQGPTSHSNSKHSIHNHRVDDHHPHTKYQTVLGFYNNDSSLKFCHLGQFLKNLIPIRLQLTPQFNPLRIVDSLTKGTIGERVLMSALHRSSFVNKRWYCYLILKTKIFNCSSLKAILYNSHLMQRLFSFKNLPFKVLQHCPKFFCTACTKI